MPNVLIVEDHPIVGESLANLVQSSFKEYSCYHVTTAQAGLAWLNGHKAAIILLDIQLPDMSGIEFCRVAKTRFHDTRILAITSMEHRHVVEQMMDCGALGFILKSSDPEEILEAISQVLNGQSYLSPKVNELLKGVHHPAENQLPILTRREMEVLKLISDGLTNQEIADKLFISAWTVDSHRKNLLMKFQAKNTAILIRIAASAGLLDL